MNDLRTALREYVKQERLAEDLGSDTRHADEAWAALEAALREMINRG